MNTVLPVRWVLQPAENAATLHSRTIPFATMRNDAEQAGRVGICTSVISSIARPIPLSNQSLDSEWTS